MKDSNQSLNPFTLTRAFFVPIDFSGSILDVCGLRVHTHSVPVFVSRLKFFQSMTRLYWPIGQFLSALYNYPTFIAFEKHQVVVSSVFSLFFPSPIFLIIRFNMEQNNFNSLSIRDVNS